MIARGKAIVARIGKISASRLPGSSGKLRKFA
jgi:hypothetical protein